MTLDRPTGPATAAGRSLLAVMPDMMTEDEAESFVLSIEAEQKARILAALPEALAQAMYGKPGMGATLDSCRRQATALAAAIEKVLA